MCQPFPPPAYDIVVAAASAGGLTALTMLLTALPENFPIPVAIVQHLHPRHKSLMADILDRRSPLRVLQAIDEGHMVCGAAYLAPPDRHFTVGPSHTVRLTQTGLVHFVRPSADRLFESAAASCTRVIAVVLTGTGRDGADGVVAIKAAGGYVIAQDEGSSAFFGMPHAAIHTGKVDAVLPLDAIAPALMALLRRPAA
jgi:two-component system chemotaxis response regulator CheB